VPVRFGTGGVPVRHGRRVAPRAQMRLASRRDSYPLKVEDPKSPNGSSRARTASRNPDAIARPWKE
jgi:hypothetical protein